MIPLATFFQIAALSACSNAHMQERFACLVPEYGGFFYDSSRVLNVYVIDSSRAVQFRPILRSAFRVPSSQDFRILIGKYTYRELDGFLKAIGDLGKGIAMVSIGGRHNRVEIVYVTDSARESVTKRIHDLRLPADAFGFEKGDYIQVLSENELADRPTLADAEKRSSVCSLRSRSLYSSLALKL